MSAINDITGKVDSIFFFGLGLFDNFLFNMIYIVAYAEGTGSD
jgi:hypothetical protein